MNKPEILKGKVKEFIEYAGYSEARTFELRMFYKQPLKPEMITEYFERWKLRERNTQGKFFFVQEVEIQITEDKLFIRTYGDDIYEFPNPKTLSQFITNCIQAGIKLTWR